MISSCTLNQILYAPISVDRTPLPSYNHKDKIEVLKGIKEFLEDNPDETLVIGNTQFSYDKNKKIIKIIIKLSVGKKIKIEAGSNSFLPDSVQSFFENLRSNRIEKKSLLSILDKISQGLENSGTRDMPSFFEKILHRNAIDVIKTVERKPSSKQLNIIYSRPID